MALKATSPDLDRTIYVNDALGGRKRSRGDDQFSWSRDALKKYAAWGDRMPSAITLRDLQRIVSSVDEQIPDDLAVLHETSSTEMAESLTPDQVLLLRIGAEDHYSHAAVDVTSLGSCNVYGPEFVNDSLVAFTIYPKGVDDDKGRHGDPIVLDGISSIIEQVRLLGAARFGSRRSLLKSVRIGFRFSTFEQTSPLNVYTIASIGSIDRMLTFALNSGAGRTER